MKKIVLIFMPLVLLASLTTMMFFMSTSVEAATCGGVDVAFLECDSKRNTGSKEIEDSALWTILEMVLNIMIGLVGIAAVGGLVFAAIIYSSAQDNASQVQQAKDMIRNVVIGIVLFLFMWSGLQYLVPGGIF